MNSTTIDGKVITDIELRKTNKKQIPVVNFRLVHNERRRENPVYVDVEVWGREAENLAENAGRGSYVVVYGELRRDVWEATNTGGEPETRSKLKITANRVVVGDSVSKSHERGEETHLSF